MCVCVCVCVQGCTVCNYDTWPQSQTGSILDTILATPTPVAKAEICINSSAPFFSSSCPLNLSQFAASEIIPLKVHPLSY